MKIDYDENKVPFVEVGDSKVQFECDEFTEEFFKEVALKELREVPENVEKGLRELRELLKADTHLTVPHEADEFLIKFLRPCKFYAQSAYEQICRFYKFRSANPEYCEGLVPEKVRGVFETNVILLQGPRDKLGRRVLLIEAGGKWRPSEVSLAELFRGVQLALEAAMAEPRTQVAGVVVIMDMQGFSFHHAMQVTPHFAKSITEWVQECIPIRLKAVHLVNQPYIFNMVYALFKPFLQEKLRARIHFHGRGRDQLHAMVGREALRPRHGGTMHPEELPGDLHWQLMHHYEDRFRLADSFGYSKKDKK